MTDTNNALTNGRGNNGSKNKQGHYKRHNPRYFLSFKLIPDQGHRANAWTCDTYSLKSSTKQHISKAGCKQGHKATEPEYACADVNRRFMPDAFGQRTIQKLSHCD